MLPAIACWGAWVIATFVVGSLRVAISLTKLAFTVEPLVTIEIAFGVFLLPAAIIMVGALILEQRLSDVPSKWRVRKNRREVLKNEGNIQVSNNNAD